MRRFIVLTVLALAGIGAQTASASSGVAAPAWPAPVSYNTVVAYGHCDPLKRHCRGHTVYDSRDLFSLRTNDLVDYGDCQLWARSLVRYQYQPRYLGSSMYAGGEQYCDRWANTQGVYTYVKEFWLSDRQWHLEGAGDVGKAGGNSTSYSDAWSFQKCDVKGIRRWDNTTHGFYQNYEALWYVDNAYQDGYFYCVI